MVGPAAHDLGCKSCRPYGHFKAHVEEWVRVNPEDPFSSACELWDDLNDMTLSEIYQQEFNDPMELHRPQLPGKEAGRSGVDDFGRSWG